jgi:hypothetical protein
MPKKVALLPVVVGTFQVVSFSRTVPSIVILVASSISSAKANYPSLS